jgi:hypothetical protein
MPAAAELDIGWRLLPANAPLQAPESFEQTANLKFPRTQLLDNAFKERRNKIG